MFTIFVLGRTIAKKLCDKTFATTKIFASSCSVTDPITVNVLNVDRSVSGREASSRSAALHLRQLARYVKAAFHAAMNK